jgi:hypothetical protein
MEDSLPGDLDGFQYTSSLTDRTMDMFDERLRTSVQVEAMAEELSIKQA